VEALERRREIGKRREGLKISRHAKGADRRSKKDIKIVLGEGKDARRNGKSSDGVFRQKRGGKRGLDSK